MSAPRSFPIYERKHASGSSGYRVDMGMSNGRRIYKSFKTKEQAERFQTKCIKLEAQKDPAVFADVKEFTRHEVLAALARLKEYRASITEAVDFFIKPARPAKADGGVNGSKSCSVGKVI